jgi:hypothetical protein
VLYYGCRIGEEFYFYGILGEGRVFRYGFFDVRWVWDLEEGYAEDFGHGC